MQSMINNKTILIKQLTAHQKEIKALGVKQLGVFGSFAKGVGIHKDSDVDLLVEFEQGKKTYDNFMDLSFFLEELLGRKIELITQQSLSKYIGPHILKQVENIIL